MRHLFQIMVKFPHSPILYFAFSSWIEKTMTKTIHCYWGNRFVYSSMGLCGNFYPNYDEVYGSCCAETALSSTTSLSVFYT